MFQGGIDAALVCFASAGQGTFAEQIHLLGTK